MREIIRLSSAGLVLIAGTAILILWIIAANDKGTGDSGDRKCRGIIQLFHESMADGDFKTSAPSGSTPFSDSLNTWVKNNREAYPILIAFGVIIGVFWMATGVIGFFSKNDFMTKLYLFVGAATYAMFVVLFPIIEERFKFAEQYQSYLWATKGGCRTDNDWTVKHGNDSYEEFWGAALFGFIIGAFQISSAVYLCATSDGSPIAGAKS